MLRQIHAAGISLLMAFCFNASGQIPKAIPTGETQLIPENDYLPQIPEIPENTDKPPTDRELEEIPEYAKGPNVPTPMAEPWLDSDPNGDTGVLPSLGDINLPEEGGGRTKFAPPAINPGDTQQAYWYTKGNETRGNLDPLFFKIVRTTFLSPSGNRIQVSEDYIQVHVENNEIRISPVIEGNGWDAYEITNRENDWEIQKRSGVEFKTAIPCLQGISLTPEKITTIKLTPKKIEFLKQDGKEGSRHLLGFRVRPETMEKIKAWWITTKEKPAPSGQATLVVEQSFRNPSAYTTEAQIPSPPQGTPFIKIKAEQANAEIILEEENPNLLKKAETSLENP